MLVRGHPITIAEPGISLNCAQSASSVALPNRRDGTKAKWVLVMPNLDDNSFQFINTGGTPVDADTGISLTAGGGPHTFNVSGLDEISFRNALGGAGTVDDCMRIYALEDT